MRLIAIFLTLIISSAAQGQGLSPFGSWDNHGRFHHPDGSTQKFKKKKKYQFEEYDYYYEPNWQTQIKPPPPGGSWSGGNKPDIRPVAPAMVEYLNDEELGTIIIDNESKKLYYVLDHDLAYEYPIAVGRDGFRWTGEEVVSKIQYWPDWNPPKEMLARRSDLPEHMSGGINNPLGAVAIYLGTSLYRIHGSNEPKSIGTEASSGCFRMHNEHALHLATMVKPGVTVVKVY